MMPGELSIGTVDESTGESVQHLLGFVILGIVKFDIDILLQTLNFKEFFAGEGRNLYQIYQYRLTVAPSCPIYERNRCICRWVNRTPLAWYLNLNCGFSSDITTESG